MLLLGHWDFSNDGCDSDSTVPAAYKRLMTLPACQPIASKLRYFVGHKHCNLIWEKDVGFMVGANGMVDGFCDPMFGIPVVDTTGGQFKVYYFPINNLASGLDNFDAVLSCVKQNGVSGCYHLAVDWTHAPVA